MFSIQWIKREKRIESGEYLTLATQVQVTGCVIYPPVVMKKQAMYFTPVVTCDWQRRIM